MPDLGTGTTDRDLLIKAIRDEIKDIQVVAIAIDTMRKATQVETKTAPRTCRRSSQTADRTSTTFSCTTLAVHHSPRSDNGRGAGTNAIEEGVPTSSCR